MAPLTSVPGKKSSSSSTFSGFDEFDDLLDAPVKNTKKGKGKSKKTKKKSSSKKSFDSDQSYDNLDEPDSPGGALSPHYGNSMERDDFMKLDMPRGLGDGDLDDSILGGLMGGPPKSLKSKIPEATKSEVREGISRVLICYFICD